MKVKGNKKGSGNGPNHFKLKGVKKPNRGLKTKTVKKSKSNEENTASEKKKEKDTKNYASFKRGKKNSDKPAFKGKRKLNKSKGNKAADSQSSGSSGLTGQKRKAEGDSDQLKKKLRVKKEDEIQTRLDRKELKVARRKRKQNYEITVSLIKKYDGLRRYVISVEVRTSLQSN